MVAILFRNVFTDVAHILKYFCTELSHRKPTHFFPSTIPFCGENFFVNTKTVSIPLNTAAFLWSFSRSVRAHWPKKQNAGW
jgi:hypothetical protein